MLPGIHVLPEAFPTDSLGAYTNVSMTTDTLRTFQLIEGFAAINHRECFEVKWSKDMTTLPTRFVCIPWYDDHVCLDTDGGKDCREN